MKTMALSIKNIGIQFGGLKAVDNFSLDLPEGCLYGLIGPNGAGKTTAFNLLTGVYQPSQGEILLGGTSLVGKAPYEISNLGIARTFQNIRLFKGLSVLENVLIAAHSKHKSNFFKTAMHFSSFLNEEKEMHDRAFNLLKIFKLENKAHEISSSLPYGDQRKLEIVRALATSPKILMLDEPAAGMNHAETHQLMHTIREIKDQFNLTVLLIEHDMKLVMGICEKILVLDRGQSIAFGSPVEIQSNKSVIEAYLGTDSEAQA